MRQELESPKWVTGCTDQEKETSSGNFEEVNLAKFGEFITCGEKRERKESA